MLLCIGMNLRKNVDSIIIFSSDMDISGLCGTMEWICKSKYRPGHKRKNWFVDVSMIPEVTAVEETVSQDNIRIEKFHCGGPGGQNVNKVESGIRIVHKETGIVVTSTKERSQYLNKQDAVKKLSTILKHLNIESKDKQKNEAWNKTTQIVRGNPVRVYIGEDFRILHG